MTDKKYFVIEGLGGGFDGLLVEEGTSKSEKLAPLEFFYCSPARLIDRDSIVGDRNVSLPLPDGALYIDRKYLTEVTDPGIREYDNSNPYGKFILEGRMDCGPLRVTYAQFEKNLQVSVFDTEANRTLYSQNFSKNFDKVKQTIEEALKDGDQEGADLVFSLNELKEVELNG